MKQRRHCSDDNPKTVLATYPEAEYALCDECSKLDYFQSFESSKKIAPPIRPKKPEKKTVVFECNDDNPKEHIEKLGHITVKWCTKCWRESVTDPAT